MAKPKNTTDEAPVINEGIIEQPDTAPETPTESGEEVRAPRKRGRPSKAEQAERAAASAGAAPVGNDGKNTASRGRPKKSKPSFDASARVQLAGQIKGLHALAAMATGIPEFQLADQEAGLLANAMATVAEEYGLSLSGKTGALIQLAAACAMVYAPRLYAVNERVKANRAKVVEGIDVTVNGAAHHGETAATSPH